MADEYEHEDRNRCSAEAAVAWGQSRGSVAVYSQHVNRVLEAHGYNRKPRYEYDDELEEGDCHSSHQKLRGRTVSYLGDFERHSVQVGRCTEPAVHVLLVSFVLESLSKQAAQFAGR